MRAQVCFMVWSLKKEKKSPKVNTLFSDLKQMEGREQNKLLLQSPRDQPSSKNEL